MLHADLCLSLVSKEGGLWQTSRSSHPPAAHFPSRPSMDGDPSIRPQGPEEASAIGLGSSPTCLPLPETDLSPPWCPMPVLVLRPRTDGGQRAGWWAGLRVKGVSVRGPLFSKSLHVWPLRSLIQNKSVCLGSVFPTGLQWAPFDCCSPAGNGFEPPAELPESLICSFVLKE